ncbi:MAG: N-acetylneuraminate synthase family protein, partial [bacterium]
FASAWDTGSLRIMMNVFDMPFIKIPSALITYKPLLEACEEWESPIILSTGMSTPKMIDEAIDILSKERIYCIMHCTSTYPTDPEEINARYILALRKRYPWAKIGFSNHYPGLMAMALAVAFGAEMLEFHVTLDRSMYGSDQAASIEPQGIFRLKEYVKLIAQMKGDGIKKIYDSEQPIISKLRRQ